MKDTTRMLKFAMTTGLATLVEAWNFAVFAAEPLGTAFTYQGSLTESNAPANGLYEIETRIFDAGTNGNLVANICQPISVANGLFTVQIPQGGPLEIFNGEPRWLELAVRHSGSTNPFTRLEPRQQVGAAPYANFAFNAETANSIAWDDITSIPSEVGITYRAGQGLTEFRPIFNPPGHLVEFSIAPGAVDSSMLAAKSVTAEKVASGSVLKSLNGLRDEVTLAAGDGLTILVDTFDNGAALEEGGLQASPVPSSNVLCIAFNTNGATAGQILTYDGSKVGWKDPVVHTGSVTTASIADGAVTASKVAQGTLLKSFNGLHDDVLLSVKGGLSLNTIGNLIELEAPLLGDCATYADCFWSQSGNAGTMPGLNFLGTTDNQPLEIKVANSRALRLEPAAIVNVIGGHVNNTAAAPDPLDPDPSHRPYGVTIGGGADHLATNHLAVIAGGQGNLAGGLASVVGGGSGNFVGGGRWSSVGGGLQNRNFGDISSIAGGAGNTITNASYATIGAGTGNYISGVLSIAATIAGGQANVNLGNAATIGGGLANQAVGPKSTIAGGWENVVGIDGDIGFVGGGQLNGAYARGAVVAGGGGYPEGGNKAISPWSAIVGGFDNQAWGTNSFIGGGAGNRAIGNYSTIPGGLYNSATGACSFAAGTRAKATDDGAFVWADKSPGDFGSTSSNQFLIRAAGGLGVNVNNPVPSGVSIQSPGTALELRQGSIRVTGAGVGTTGPAFIHQAEFANINGASTRIAHPDCNGKPGALLLVTYRSVGSPPFFHNHPVGVLYDPEVGQWEIANQDGAPMVIKAQFNVLVINP